MYVFKFERTAFLMLYSLTQVNAVTYLKACDNFEEHEFRPGECRDCRRSFLDHATLSDDEKRAIADRIHVDEQLAAVQLRVYLFLKNNSLLRVSFPCFIVFNFVIILYSILHFAFSWSRVVRHFWWFLSNHEHLPWRIFAERWWSLKSIIHVE